jgi:hypothetical protein
VSVVGLPRLSASSFLWSRFVTRRPITTVWSPGVDLHRPAGMVCGEFGGSDDHNACRSAVNRYDMCERTAAQAEPLVCSCYRHVSKDPPMRRAWA